MINKKAAEWEKAPFWVKHGLWGIKSRNVALGFEIFSLFVALICLIIGIVNPAVLIGIVFFGVAYWYAISIRWVDNAGLW